MPGRDGTGPNGQGSMTGWGNGLCNEASETFFGGRGQGRRMGYGRAFGRGLGLAVTAAGAGLRFGKKLYENLANQPVSQSDKKAQEIEKLKNQVETLKAEVENLKKS